MQRLNYSGQESKKRFAVYNSNIPVTLKQGQSHKIWYELVDPKQAYNHTKFEKPHFDSVREKANVKGLFIYFLIE